MNSKLLSILFSFTILYSNAQDSFVINAGLNGTTQNSCNGFIIDSGDQGGPGYGLNEDITVTFCPDAPNEEVAIQFNLFNLNETDDGSTPGTPTTDYMIVYDGNSTAAPVIGTYTGDELQNEVLQTTLANATGCITIHFVSNGVGAGNFAGIVTCDTPCNNPIAGGFIVDGILPDSIQVCVGTDVLFQEQGSFAQFGFNIVNYEWDFMDGTTATGQNVSHAYDVPGQYRVQLFVTDDNGCTNFNLTDLQVFVGTVPSFVGFPSDAELCLGESITLSATPGDYQVEWDGFDNVSEITDGCLDGDLLGVPQGPDLFLTGFNAGSVINSIADIESICFEMEHSYVGDLVVSIECPSGQIMTIHQQGGGGTFLGEPIDEDNVDCNDPSTLGVPYKYCFTPSATQTWVEWVNANGFPQTIPEGDYEPIQSFNNLVGCQTNGTWTLRVIDNWAFDDGNVTSLQINLNSSFYPDVTSFEPQIGLNADSSYWDTSASFITNQTPDGNNITIEPTAPGSYDYTYYVTDNFGCEYDSTVTLTINDNAAIFAGNDTTICFGNTINLNGVLENASGGCAYELVLEDTFGDSWNGNTITVTVDGVSTNYTVSTGDLAVFPLLVPNGENIQLTFNANGNWIGECEFSLVDEDGVTVLQGGPNLSAPLTLNTTASCEPDYIFEWAAGTNLSNPSIANPVWSPQIGEETLTLSVYPIGHPLCISEDQITATVIELPYTGEDGAVDFCSVDAPADLFVYLQNNPDTGGTWTDENDMEIAMPFDPGTLTTGTYVFTYTLGGDDCMDQSFVTVSIIETEITTTLVTDVTCNNGSNGQIDVEGINIDSYQLNGGTPVAANAPFSISNLTAGTYVLDVFSNGGCTDQVTFEVNEPLPLTITSISNDTIICYGGQATLNAEGTGGSSDYIYTWSLNGTIVGIGSTITVNPPIGVSNYCLELSEVCGSPVATQCMNVTTEELIIPSLLVDTIAGCSAHQVDFTNTSNGSISTTFIDFGDGSDITVNGNDPFEHTFVVPGQYDLEVIITSTIGCVYMADFENIVEVYPNPTALFTVSPDSPTIFDPVALLQDYSIGDIINWQWDIEGGTPSGSSMENVVVQFPELIPAVYDATLYVTTPYGCIDSLTKQIQVVNDVTLYAPTAFTPDGDEFNQYWKVEIQGIEVGSFDLKIFNRWGEMIWESNDYTIGWDGTYNGKVAQTGSYVWTIECKDAFTDKKYSFNGHLNLLK